MEENTNNIIEFNEESNMSSFIGHGNKIIIHSKERNWDNAIIKAFREQVVYDSNIFYGIINEKMKQLIINNRIITLLNINNNDVSNLRIEFKNEICSTIFKFYLNRNILNQDFIDNKEILTIIIYEN